jgi:hypothetical protein
MSALVELSAKTESFGTVVARRANHPPESSLTASLAAGDNNGYQQGEATVSGKKPLSRRRWQRRNRISIANEPSD